MMARLPLAELKSLLQEYDLGNLKSAKVLHKGWNVLYRASTGSGEYLVKFLPATGKKALESEFRAIRALSKDVPHASLISTRSGKNYLRHKGKFVYVIPFIEGEVIEEGADLSMAALREVGSCLAKMHRTDPRCVKAKDLRKEFHRRFAKRKPSLANDALVLLEKEGFYTDKLPSGFIHGDLHTENMIFKGDTIVAILDFETAYRGPYLHDLGLTMLDTCFKAGKLSKQRMSQLLRGYESVRKLAALEKRHLENAIIHGGLLALQEIDIAQSRDADVRKLESTSPYKDRLEWFLRGKKKL
jgi:homoserine kinase type II